MAVETKPLLSHRFKKSTSLSYLNFLSTLPFFYISHLITLVNTHLDKCTATSSSNMPQTYFQDILPGCEQQHQFQITPGRTASKSQAHSSRLISKSSLISLTIFFVSLSLPLHFCCLPHPLLQRHTGHR